jgi:hypothetical protein
MTLEEFLASNLRSVWVREPGIAVYVRKGLHVILDEGAYTLDVANVEVDEALRHKGVFKAWLAKAERLNPYPFVYVENVHNPILHDFLVREGYSTLPLQCYTKRLQASKN